MRKLSAVESPEWLSATWEECVPGVWDPSRSLPVGYEIEGELFEPIVIGQRVLVFRTRRNGVYVKRRRLWPTPGLFLSDTGSSTPLEGALFRGRLKSAHRTHTLGV